MVSTDKSKTNPWLRSTAANEFRLSHQSAGRSRNAYLSKPVEALLGWTNSGSLSTNGFRVPNSTSGSCCRLLQSSWWFNSRQALVVDQRAKGRRASSREYFLQSRLHSRPKQHDALQQNFVVSYGVAQQFLASVSSPLCRIQFHSLLLAPFF